MVNYYFPDSRLSGSSRSSGVNSGPETNNNNKVNYASTLEGVMINKSFEIDSPADNSLTYADPLGPPIERPRTGAKKVIEQDSEDDMNPEELLPM